MPKYNIIIKPGKELSGKLQKLVKDYFDEKQLEKLERFGGRIQILLTAPYTDRKAQDAHIVINELFIAEIKKNLVLAQKKLSIMTKNQLKEVAKLLNFPIPSKANTKEVRNSIIDFLGSAKKWQGISGSTK